MADAGHNLSDVLGLVLAWGAAVLAKRAPSARYTYGLRSTSILAALGNAVLLLVACGAIAWEAVHRLTAPAPVAGMTVSVVAAIGVAINGFSAWLFMAGSKGDLNIRGAYLHMAADAAISLGVVISGLVIMGTGWTWLDPAVSLVIVVVIVLGTWSLLRESLRLVMAAVPDSVDARAVDRFLARAARRGQRARPAHLGDEHDRDGADGAPGDAGRLSGGQGDRRDRDALAPRFRDRALHAAGRRRDLAAPVRVSCSGHVPTRSARQIGEQCGTQITFAERRDDHHDHLARILRPLRHLHRRPQGRARRNPDQQALLAGAARAVSKAFSLLTAMISS